MLAVVGKSSSAVTVIVVITIAVVNAQSKLVHNPCVELIKNIAPHVVVDWLMLLANAGFVNVNDKK